MQVRAIVETQDKCQKQKPFLKVFFISFFHRREGVGCRKAVHKMLILLLCAFAKLHLHETILLGSVKYRFSAGRSHLTPEILRNCKVLKQQQQDWCVSGDFSHDYAKAYGGGNMISQLQSKFRNRLQHCSLWKILSYSSALSGSDPQWGWAQEGEPHLLHPSPEGQLGPFSLEDSRSTPRLALCTQTLILAGKCSLLTDKGVYSGIIQTAELVRN